MSKEEKKEEKKLKPGKPSGAKNKKKRKDRALALKKDKKKGMNIKNYAVIIQKKSETSLSDSLNSELNFENLETNSSNLNAKIDNNEVQSFLNQNENLESEQNLQNDEKELDLLPSSVSVQVQDEIMNPGENISEKRDSKNCEDSNKNLDEPTELITNEETEKTNLQSTSEDIYQTDSYVDLFDPAFWNKSDKKLIDYLILEGVEQVTTFFPKDKKGRRFSVKHYMQVLPNNESIKRSWLIYSKTLNKIFCFCCFFLIPILKLLLNHLYQMLVVVIGNIFQMF